MPCKFTSCCCWRIWKRHDDDEVDEGAKEKENAKENDVPKEEEANDVPKEEKTNDVPKEEETNDASPGNPRNKCALQPGHSLMDWIRLGSSGKDLTGVGAKAGHMSVTKHELSLHNKESNAWLAIRGKVYNITEYLPFHPGGPDELMKGAGIDATKLFEQVHPWVNYDQILQKCFIGRLVSFDPGVNAEALLFEDKSTSLRNTTNANHSPKLPLKPSTPETITKVESVETPVLKEPEIEYLENYPALSKVESTSNSQSEESEEQQEEPPNVPRFDWIQRLDWITIFFYTTAFANPLVEVLPPNPDNTIVVCLTYDETVYRNEINFYESVSWPCTIKLAYETGKIELVFRKNEGKIWESYGILRQHNKPVDVVVNGAKFNFIFREKMQVNHNIFLIRLEGTDGGKIVVPIGKHVRVFGNIDGEEMSRSYTPVPHSLFTNLKLFGPVTDSICLMIKRYEDGNVSRFVTDRETNDVIHATKPLGDFDLRRLQKRDTFILLAAGTGITPMLTILVFLLERRIKQCQFARLLFFNKTERDIPFRDQLESLEQFDPRLKIDHILSEPSEHWTGLTGHVNKEMIENALQEHIKDTGYTINHIFCLVCGPNPFVALVLEEVYKIGLTDEQIHAFQG